MKNLHLSNLTNLLMGLILLTLWFLLVGIAGVVLSRRWPNQKEWTRKLIHIGMGPVILIAWIAAIPRIISLGIGIVTTFGIFLNYKLQLVSVIEDINRHSYGTISYGLAVTTLLWLYWPNEPTSIVAGLMVMGFGDGFAGLLGSTFSSPSWKVWGQRKSVIGTFTMLSVSILVLLIISSFSPAHISYKQIVDLSIIATMLEQIAIIGLDNFIVPLVISYLWQICVPLVT
uniref:Dolichol kinase n=1 Tax=Paulinella longichromatophora TaxID=1708747 RepID=A0A2H4ZPD3_9EUKA|nr:hypothetical protein PLO_384 [Paulinella longichromatophora]